MRERKWYQRTTFIASAAVILLALVASAVVGMAHLFGRNDAKGTPPAPGASTAAPAPTTAGECPSDTSAATPTAPPAGVRWQALGPVLLPYGDSRYGPCRVTDTTASGYAHTPTGALIAGVQIFGRSGVTDPSAVAEETIKSQYVNNTDRDMLLAGAKQTAGTPMNPDRIGRVAAYSLTSYTPDTATISLALQANAVPGQYVVVPLILRWVDGDWRLVPPIGGSWSGTGQVVVQLNGFVAWGAR